MKKKIIAFAMVLSLVGLCVLMATASVEGDTSPALLVSEQNAEDFTYKVTSTENKEVMVEKYSGNASVINIPSTRTIDGEVYEVTSIDNEAFMGKGMDSLIIPDTMKEIGNHAFKDCNNLKTITMPTSVDSIGSKESPAFEGCIGIVEVTLTKGDGTWFQYKDLKHTPWNISKDSFETLILGEGIEKVDKEYFKNCTHLKRVTFPTSLKTVGKKSFENCKALESVSLDAKTTKIEDKAFANCENLSSLEMKGVKTIGKKAFIDCKSLETLVLPDCAEKLDSFSFKNCSGLKSIKLPVTLNANGNKRDPSFTGCKQITTTTLTKGDDGKCVSYESQMPTAEQLKGPWVFSKGSMKNLVVEEGVKSIGKRMFMGCDKIDNITFPNSLEKIDYYAFSGCKSIHTLVIPDKVNKVDSYAFGSCEGITELTIPISTRANDGFSSCTNVEKVIFTPGSGKGASYPELDRIPWITSKNKLKTVIISEGITSLGRNTFKGCSKLESVTLPSTLTSIGDYVFYKCKKLENLDLPSGVKKLGISTFEGCEKLKDIHLENVTSIEKYCMSGCSAFKTITLPDTLKSVGIFAFENCKGLKEISVPISVDYKVDHDHAPFKGCKNIEKVVITPGTGKGFNYDTTNETPWGLSSKLKSVVLTEGIIEIGNYTFLKCKSLKEITIPDSVTTIGKNAFEGCKGLKRIQFGTGLENLKKDAFMGFKFYDSDGTTSLSKTAEQLRGHTFSGKMKSMILV